ncbi:hypothetical protein LTR66_002491 [Elasticomyces elasticus]|nr:hypothetical protein LTR66_002491 [Elasticomyces elasticus]
MSPSSKMTVVALAALRVFTNLAKAHTWVEEIQAIASDGSYTGDYGYPRGYVQRTDPSFNGDSNLWLLPALSSSRTCISDSDLVCKDTQRMPNKNTQWPNLKYLENGHVTLPDDQKGKPRAGGTVFIYRTTQPSRTETITDVLKWTADGSGGTKKGLLLAAQNYDDGRCHQRNGGTISVQRQGEFADHEPNDPENTNPLELWCESDVQVPSTAKVGEVWAIYWVWQWPTTPNVDPILPNGKDEYYTSCADFDIVDGPIPDTQVHTLVQQDPMRSAVQDFTSRTALTTFPTVTVASSTSSAASAPPAIDSTTLSAISTVSPSSALAPFAQAIKSHNISTTLASITVSETTEVSVTTVILTDYVTVIAPAFTTLITMSGFAAPSGS